MTSICSAVGNVHASRVYAQFAFNFKSGKSLVNSIKLNYLWCTWNMRNAIIVIIIILCLNLSYFFFVASFSNNFAYFPILMYAHANHLHIISFVTCKFSNWKLDTIFRFWCLYYLFHIIQPAYTYCILHTAFQFLECPPPPKKKPTMYNVPIKNRKIEYRM